MLFIKNNNYNTILKNMKFSIGSYYFLTCKNRVGHKGTRKLMGLGWPTTCEAEACVKKALYGMDLGMTNMNGRVNSRGPGHACLLP